MFRKFMNHEKGITGLETAIILIAFVVVAAVFAYTALSAGLFSTQKSQEAVYSGLKEARSTLELKGGVVAVAGTTGSSGNVAQIKFIVSNVLGGEAIDFTEPNPASANSGIADTTNDSNVVVINYTDQYQAVDNLYWQFDPLGNDDTDNLLEMNERFQITVGSETQTTAGGNLLDALTTQALGPKTTFNLEILTPVGAVLQIERTTPPWIDTIMNLR
jgi:flagellin FlaB